MFNLHANNIHGIEAATNAFGEIWFHGDGNIYHKKEDSDFRKDFSNGSDSPATYRKHFKKGDTLPTNVEDLTKVLLNSKTQEVIEASKPKEVSGIATFNVSIPSGVQEAKADADAKAAEQKVKEDADAKAKADADAKKK